MKPSKDKSSMRYFLASLKPFGSPLFWGPLGLLALGLILGWQYQQHPEWLNTVIEQPAQTIDGNPIPADSFQTPIDPNAATGIQQPTTNSQENKLTPGIDPTEILTLSPEQARRRTRTSTNTNTTNPSQTTTQPGTQDNKTSIFMPLLPTVKSNTQTTTTQTTLNPIAVDPVPTREYPLQKALESAPSSQSYNNSPRYNGYNNYGGTPNTGTSGYNRVPTLPNQSSYSNSGNPYTQNYQSPYSTNNYQQTTPVNPYAQNYQSPYSNYNQPRTAVPQTQGNNNSNDYYGQNGQNQNYRIQPPIDAEPIGD